MSENFLDWEEDYKAKYLAHLQQAVADEMRGEFEGQMRELIEEERLKIQEDSQQALVSALQEAKEEAERLFDDRVAELKDHYER